MKLTEKTFQQSIKYLTNFYTNFNFNVAVEIDKAKIWFGVFENMDDEIFKDLIKRYCVENIYAPQSPTHLLEFYNQKVFDKYQPKIEEAWQTLLGGIRRYGLGYTTIWSPEQNDFVNVNRLEDTLKNHDDKLILETYNMIKSRLRTMNDDNEPFVRKEFVEIYESLLKRQIQETVIKGSVSLTNKDTLKLGEKK